MDLTIHNLPSGRLKNEFGEVDETMFEGVEIPQDIYFLHPVNRKKRLE
jgi:hypothetical protein